MPGDIPESQEKNLLAQAMIEPIKAHLEYQGFGEMLKTQEKSLTGKLMGKMRFFSINNNKVTFAKDKQCFLIIKK